MRTAGATPLTARERRELQRFVRDHVWYQSISFGELRPIAMHDTDRLLRRIGWPPIDLAGATFLDAGCHTGAHLYKAVEHGARLAVGIEISRDEVRLARRALAWKVRLGEVRPEAVRILDGDVQEATAVLARHELPRRYDLVHFFSVLQHLRRPLQALRELAALTERALLVEAVCEPEGESQTRILSASLPEVVPPEIRPAELVVPARDLIGVLQATGGWRRIEHLGKGKRRSRDVFLCWR